MILYVQMISQLFFMATSFLVLLILMSSGRNDIFLEVVKSGYLVNIEIFDVDDAPTIGVVEYGGQKFYIQLVHLSIVNRNDIIKGYFLPNQKFAVACDAVEELKKNKPGESPNALKNAPIWCLVLLAVAGGSLWVGQSIVVIACSIAAIILVLIYKFVRKKKV